jgi:hypothetical protein
MSHDKPRLGSTGFTELAVRADELTAPPPGTTRAYIVENEVTYLAFPAGEPGPAVRLEQERVGFRWIRQALAALGH